jgi:cytochrome P450
LHLGKLEAKIALEALLDRYQSMELAPEPGSAVRRGTPGFRGFKSLIVDVA